MISFESGKQAPPTGLIIHNLIKIFPACNTAVYQGDLVILAKASPDSWNLSFDRERLQNLLERYHAYAAIGNRSSFISSIRPIYLQTKASKPKDNESFIMMTSRPTT